MSSPIDRREFLKLLALVSAGGLLPYHLIEAARPAQDPAAPNLLVIVFDTWSAPRCSLYGHVRPNTPHLERLAERAIVYHNHISAGNYTLPGTASLLTGLLPWAHRAFDFPLAPIKRHFADRTIFRWFDDYRRMVYTHNPLAEFLLQTMLPDIDDYTERYRLMLDGDVLVNRVFENDLDAASVAWLQAMKPAVDSMNYSLFFSRIHTAHLDRVRAPYERRFPLGLPSTNYDDHFILEDGIDFIAAQVAAAEQPYLGYFHFLPPHHPYHTRSDFFQRFHRDGVLLPEKPEHVFTQGVAQARLDEQSTWYDEFVLYVDAEFGRLYELLEETGKLDNTWIVLTSDHGEMFERGIRGHNTPTLFQPVVHIPLLIFPPGQTARVDVHARTSSIDVLPTLLHIAGKEAAGELEGRVLTPFRAAEDAAQDVFSIEAQETKANDPMGPGTVALFRGNLKLIYYFGYPELGAAGERVELYDLEADPGETRDLYSEDPGLGAEMLAAVKRGIAANDAEIL